MQDLSLYNNDSFDPGAGRIKRITWYMVNSVFFDSWLLPVSAPKRLLLRLFGAKVGTDVVIKPKVNVKYPWNLVIGDHVWLGESTWLDCLAKIKIGNNVCISQGAYLLTGNHNYKIKTFDLIVGDVVIEDSVWIGARAVICPGVTVSKNCVISVGRVITKSTVENKIYQASSEAAVKERVMAD